MTEAQICEVEATPILFRNAVTIVIINTSIVAMVVTIRNVIHNNHGRPIHSNNNGSCA
jgi:hypothetical protein